MRAVHLRRAILLFALVLGLAALAAAVSPSRRTRPPVPSLAPPAPGAGALPRQLVFGPGKRRVQTAREGEHVVVSVASEAGGVATIPRLGEGGPRLGEVARALLLAVVDGARRDDLVARVAERGHRHVELVPVLRLHVLAHHGLAALAQGLVAQHVRTLPL